MRILYFCVLFMASSLLVSCESDSLLQETKEASSNRIDPIVEREYDVYEVVERKNPIDIEPSESVYLGASINNNIYKGDISKFERNFGKKHAVYVYNINVNTDKSEIEKDILACIKNNSVPYFVVDIKEKEDFDLSKFDKLSECFTMYNHPAIIEIFPNYYKSKHGVEEYEYTEFFKNCYTLIKSNASNAYVVFPTDTSAPVVSKNVYVGEEYCDAVSINTFTTGSSEYNEAYKELDYLYNLFKSKPIVVNVGISHYSANGHRYYMYSAVNELIDFYDKVVDDYTSIFCINYYDLAFKENKISFNENYSISDTTEMKEAYKKAIKNDKLTGKITREATTTKRVKFPYKAIYVNDDIYINTKCINYYEPNLFDNLLKVDGEQYIELKKFQKYVKNKSVVVDENKLEIEVK